MLNAPITNGSPGTSMPACSSAIRSGTGGRPSTRNLMPLYLPGLCEAVTMARFGQPSLPRSELDDRRGHLADILHVDPQSPQSFDQCGLEWRWSSGGSRRRRRWRVWPRRRSMRPSDQPMRSASSASHSSPTTPRTSQDLKMLTRHLAAGRRSTTALLEPRDTSRRTSPSNRRDGSMVRPSRTRRATAS